jgi:hypothetical protein
MINWYKMYDDARSRAMGVSLQHTTSVGKVEIRFNPTGYDDTTGKIAFTVGKRMTFSGPLKTLADAEAFIEAHRGKLTAVKTMAQLLKVI